MSDRPNGMHVGVVGANDAPRLEGAAIRQAERGADLPRLFAERAEVAGAGVRRVCERELVKAVRGLLCGMDPRRVLYHPEVVQRWPALEAVLAEKPGQVQLTEKAGQVQFRADDARLFGAEVGVTLADWGIAETGTLVCDSGAGRPRLTSLVPAVHLAVLDARRIVADLFDYFVALSSEALPSNITLITGPSKTADIEGVLVTGMHGPGRLEVVVVEPDRNDTPLSATPGKG